VPISGYCFEKDKLENMNPQKLFNYMLQCTETASNVLMLLKIHKLLRGKNTKIVLYTYDSFLFQMGKNEDYLIKEIKQIFDYHGFSVKAKKGLNYNDMENFTI
jgi:phage pi2 protein 07